MKIVWVIGFVVSRLLMQVDIVVGSTLPDMVITGLLCVAVNSALPRGFAGTNSELLKGYKKKD